MTQQEFNDSLMAALEEPKIRAAVVKIIAEAAQRGGSMRGGSRPIDGEVERAIRESRALRRRVRL